MFMPICDMHFDCGCSWPGPGAYAHCDIHTPGAPDCPWCASNTSLLLAVAVTYGSSLAAALWVAPRAPFAIVVLAGFAGVVVGAVVAGVATSLALGLPVLAGL
jgi:hypothetical protein